MPRKNKNARRVRPAAAGTRPRRVAPTLGSRPEHQFRVAMTAAGYPPPAEEHKFHETRRWKIDFAWPQLKLAVEIEGGIFVRGRHVSPSGFVADCEKYNTATLDGWSVLRFPVAGKTWLEDAVAMTVQFIEERIK